MTPKLQKVHFGNFTPSFISPKCPSQFKRHYPRREKKKVLKFWRHLLALSRLRLIEAKGFEFKDVMAYGSSKSMPGGISIFWGECWSQNNRRVHV